MNLGTERRLLQAVVAVLAMTPVVFGVLGIAIGPRFLHATAPWPVDLDSHLRFLSGVFLIVGLGWYSCLPAIETKTERFRMLAAATFAGGLARLISLLIAGLPSMGHVAGLCVELVAVPLLTLWQARIANRHAATSNASGA